MNYVDIDGGRLTARNADVGLHSGQSLRLPMSTESQLREKLRKIEALFAGAGTAGERLAAEAALERVRARLGELSRQDPSIEMQFSMPDQWSRHLFLALCRRYGLKPYRYYRQAGGELVVDEVHRPGLIDLACISPILTQLCPHTSPRRFAA